MFKRISQRAERCLLLVASLMLLGCTSEVRRLALLHKLNFVNCFFLLIQGKEHLCRWCFLLLKADVTGCNVIRLVSVLRSVSTCSLILFSSFLLFCSFHISCISLILLLLRRSAQGEFVWLGDPSLRETFYVKMLTRRLTSCFYCTSNPYKFCSKMLIYDGRMLLFSSFFRKNSGVQSFGVQIIPKKNPSPQTSGLVEEFEQ